MVDTHSDTLDFRSTSRALQRQRNHLARYGSLPSHADNVGRVKPSDIRLNPIAYNAALNRVCAHDTSSSRSKPNTLTPGQARREIFKDYASAKKRGSCCSTCTICNPPPRHVWDVEPKRLARIVKGKNWRTEDAFVSYSDFKVSIWDTSLLDENFYTFEEGEKIWGGDWSAAVDIAEQKFKEKCQGLSVSTSPSVSLGNSPRTLPQSPSWAATDDWILWDDHFTDYSSASDWEVI